jgi:hypothetical protein
MERVIAENQRLRTQRNRHVAVQRTRLFEGAVAEDAASLPAVATQSRLPLALELSLARARDGGLPDDSLAAMAHKVTSNAQQIRRQAEKSLSRFRQSTGVESPSSHGEHSTAHGTRGTSAAHRVRSHTRAGRNDLDFKSHQVTSSPALPRVSAEVCVCGWVGGWVGVCVCG